MHAENLEEIYISNTTSVVAVKYEKYATTASANFTSLTKLSAIYVPDDLVDDYQASAYWKPVAGKIKALSTAPNN